jgi:molybdopterin converting factor small subunit
MPILRIPSPLRPYAEGRSEIEVQGRNVDEVLNHAVQQHPNLKKHLYSDKGDLRPFVHVFLNGDDIRQLAGLYTPLEKNDTLKIIPSIAGG